MLLDFDRAADHRSVVVDARGLTSAGVGGAPGGVVGDCRGDVEGGREAGVAGEPGDVEVGVVAWAVLPPGHRSSRRPGATACRASANSRLVTGRPLETL